MTSLKAILPVSTICALGVVCAVSQVARSDALDYKFPKLSGSYLEYSGELGETRPPTRRDMQLSIEIDGRLAYDMFRALPATSATEDCAPEGTILRFKNDISCELTKGTNSARCFVGLDLKTGRSTVGAIC